MIVAVSSKRLIGRIAVVLALALTITVAHANPWQAYPVREENRQTDNQGRQSSRQNEMRRQDYQREERREMQRSRLSPEERRQLRRDVRDAGKELYIPRR